MGKWLGLATVVVLAALALLWLQIREPAAAVTAAPKQEVAAVPAAAAKLETASDLAKAAQKVREAEAKGSKIDPASDAMTYHFDEIGPGKLTAAAAQCYTGGLHRVHRNQKTKLGLKWAIKDGKVSVSDVHIVESTIDDKVLNDCFLREVAKVSWQDDQLPDWGQDDELVLRPERGMKKWMKDNIDYEGDGPIGKLESPVGPVHGSREQPEDQRAADDAQ